MGVDLGLRNTGLCFGDASGNVFDIRTVVTKKSDYRLKSHQLWYECYGLSRNLQRLLKTADCIAVELPHGGVRGNNATALRLMSAAVGLFAGYTVLHSRQPRVILCTPNEVKKAVSAKGAVSKEQVIEYCNAKYPHLDWGPTKGIHEHMADAIVVYELLIKRLKSGES